MKKFLTFAFVLISAAILTGCETVDDQSKNDARNDHQKMLGTSYYLSSLTLNGVVLPTSNTTDYMLRLDDEDRISGRLLCNGFSLTTVWQADSVVTVQNWSKVKSDFKTCANDGVNFSFESQMVYKFQGRKLYLSATDDSWVAEYQYINR